MGSPGQEDPIRVSLYAPSPPNLGTCETRTTKPFQAIGGASLYLGLLPRCSDALSFEHLHHEFAEGYSPPDRCDLEPYVLALWDIERHSHKPSLATPFSWSSG